MTTDLTPTGGAQPTGALILADGTVFWGHGFGAAARAVGEVCFNTSITGYQEILTDPSYAGQIITFTFPHIGNVGTNPEDIETVTPAARGLVVRADVTEPASWRAARAALSSDFTPLTDQRASAAYRTAIAANLLERALVEIAGTSAPTRIGELHAAE